MASPLGLIQAANRVVTITMSAAPTFTLTAGKEYLVAGATLSGYNGLYLCLTVPGVDSITAIPSTVHPLLAPAAAVLAASGGGTLQPGPQYNSMVRVEDLNWVGEVTQGDKIYVTDQNGSDIWQSTASGPGGFNRGKLFWVNGLWVKTLDSGELFATVN